MKAYLLVHFGGALLVVESAGNRVGVFSDAEEYLILIVTKRERERRESERPAEVVSRKKSLGLEFGIFFALLLTLGVRRTGCLNWPRDWRMRR